MEWSIDDCLVVGGMRGLESKAPFSRAMPVLRRRDSEWPLLRISSYRTLDSVRGTRIEDVDEWQDLIVSKQAFAILRSYEARQGAIFYLFRRRAELLIKGQALTDLERTGALLEEALRLDNVLICFVDETLSNPIRDEWLRHTYDQACDNLRSGQYDRALEMAKLSYVLQKRLSIRQTALRALAHERKGEQSEADSFLDVLRTNKGKDAYVEALAFMSSLRQTIPNTSRRVHSKRSFENLNRADRHLRNSLRPFLREKAA